MIEITFRALRALRGKKDLREMNIIDPGNWSMDLQGCRRK